MKRRIFLSALAGLPFVQYAQAAAAWRAKFLQGGFDGSTYNAGLQIQLEPGWKTYWRSPGDAGIPPSITASGDNLESFDVLCPAPLRIIDGGGEALGYHDEVVFLLKAKPKDASKPLSLQLSSFFGVCDKVCTPAKFDDAIDFKQSAQDQAVLSTWQTKVPIEKTFISAFSVQEKSLVLAIDQQFTEIFVEGPDRYYFKAPDLTREPGKAWIKIAGLKNDADLKGVELRITAIGNGQGLEQRVTVA
jgi:DsbC/DsbD-like thiol-disulfide interchange protein